MKSKNHNWAALEPQIRQLAQEGLTAKQAAKILGIPDCTLYAALHRLGWRDWFPYKFPRIKYKGITDSISGHARRHGVSRDTAHARADAMRKKGKVDWDKVFTPTHKRFVLTAEQVARITEAAELRDDAKRGLDELSILKIAEKIEVSKYAVECAFHNKPKPSNVSPGDWGLVKALVEEKRRLYAIWRANSANSVAKELGIYHVRVKEMMQPV